MPGGIGRPAVTSDIFSCVSRSAFARASLWAAMNDARGKAERAAQERMADVTKGLPLPPGLKLF